MRQGGTEIRGSECQVEPGRGGEVLLASEFDAGFQPRPGGEISFPEPCMHLSCSQLVCARTEVEDETSRTGQYRDY